MVKGGKKREEEEKDEYGGSARFMLSEIKSTNSVVAEAE